MYINVSVLRSPKSECFKCLNQKDMFDQVEAFYDLNDKLKSCELSMSKCQRLSFLRCCFCH